MTNSDDVGPSPKGELSGGSRLSVPLNRHWKLSTWTSKRTYTTKSRDSLHQSYHSTCTPIVLSSLSFGHKFHN